MGKFAIDLEGTLIDNDRSLEFQETIKNSKDDWYLITAYDDPLDVEDIVISETILQPDDFVEIVCTSEKAKAAFERGITKLIDDNPRYRKSCLRYGIAFEKA